MHDLIPGSAGFNDLSAVKCFFDSCEKSIQQLTQKRLTADKLIKLYKQTEKCIKENAKQGLIYGFVLVVLLPEFKRIVGYQ